MLTVVFNTLYWNDSFSWKQRNDSFSWEQRLPTSRANETVQRVCLRIHRTASSTGTFAELRVYPPEPLGSDALAALARKPRAPSRSTAQCGCEDVDGIRIRARDGPLSATLQLVRTGSQQLITVQETNYSEFCAHAWPPSVTTPVAFHLVACARDRDSASSTPVRAVLRVELVPIEVPSGSVLAPAGDVSNTSNGHPFASAESSVHGGEARPHACGNATAQPMPRPYACPFVRVSLSGVPVGSFAVHLVSGRRVPLGEDAPALRVRGTMAALRTAECKHIEAELQGPANAIGGRSVRALRIMPAAAAACWLLLA